MMSVSLLVKWILFAYKKSRFLIFYFSVPISFSGKLAPLFPPIMMLALGVLSFSFPLIGTLMFFHGVWTPPTKMFGFYLICVESLLASLIFMLLIMLMSDVLL